MKRLLCFLETTYLKPNTHFLLHLGFVGGKKPFFLPLPTFNLGICPGSWLIDYEFFGSRRHWYEPTLSACPGQMPSLFFQFFDEQRITFFDPPGGWVGEIFSPNCIVKSEWLAIFLRFAAQDYLPGFAGNFSIFFIVFSCFTGSVFPCK